MTGRLLSWLVSLVLVLVALATPVAGQATSAVYLTDAEHAELSTAIVVATVAKKAVDTHPVYGRTRTLTTIDVEEVLYGEAPATLTIEQLGGTLDGLTLHVPGDATLELAERCVLFLRKLDGDWFLTAMEQSKFSIVPSVDGDGLERVLSSDFYIPNDHGALEPYTVELGPLPTLDDLRRDLSTKRPARRTGR